ncbi:MAG: LytTR family DNA-binding domain-containing protein [Rhizomicrobium sp.]
MTIGNRPASSGETWRIFLTGAGLVAALVGGINAINVLTITHDMPRVGVAAPIVWEGSSGLSTLCLLWIPWAAITRIPPKVRPRWLLLFHPVIAVIYSAAHVTGFVLLRKTAYALAGSEYHFGPIVTGFFYEVRKDVFGYLVFASIFWAAARLMKPQSAPPADNAHFDIRDGARIIRVRLEDILAIASAGNYVEFVLRDGRKPLMRSALSAMERELGPRGFLRTHRSWLVNAAHVTGLKPEGSGDYAVELGALSVPLSRRFPEALAKLRGD